MPTRPQPRWQMLRGEACWTIDWREFFRAGLELGNPRVTGEMRGFHVVCQLRVQVNGTLVFWDDDGSVILRNGELVHADRGSHPLSRGTVEVRIGDWLTVAQWQLHGEWLWGARLAGADSEESEPIDVLRPYLEAVQGNLRRPHGPPVKMYCNGDAASRTVLALYSLILNGYAPSEVLLYGEHQWSAASRALFADALPFARVVRTSDVLGQIHRSRLRPLADWATRYWFVFKACVGLLCPPYEFGLIDDDVFVLDRVDDGLAAFRDCDLVFTPDTDHSLDYLKTWGWLNRPSRSLPSGTFNAGLYWMRAYFDQRWLALQMLKVVPHHLPPWMWEQGLIASLFATRKVCPLPTQRYFYPLFDGLPGGILGYDYQQNPCGFASVHFGGLLEKPSDSAARRLTAGILNRSKAMTTPLRKR